MKIFKRAAGAAAFVGAMTVAGYPAVGVATFPNAGVKTSVICSFATTTDGEMLAHFTSRPFGVWERLAFSADRQARGRTDDFFDFGVAQAGDAPAVDERAELDASSGGVSPVAAAAGGFDCMDGAPIVSEGVTGSPAPEASTWAMMLIGFGCLGFAAFHRTGRPKVSILA